MFTFTKEQMENAVNKSKTYSELFSILGITKKAGNTYRNIRILLYKYNISFKGQGKSNNEEISNKICPVCKKDFFTLINNREERTTCSYSCSATLFRSGENNPGFKGLFTFNNKTYRKLAFTSLPHKCNRCNWNLHPEILQVHHKDRDRKNNKLENLEILCCNCHDWEHYIAKDGSFHNRK